MTQDEARSHVRDILSKTHLMHLGTVDDGGPWVSSVIFVYDDNFNLYWMSERETRHSKALARIQEVAATITYTSKTGEPNEGLQISGRAEKLEGDIYELGVKHLTKRGKPAPQPGEAVLDPEESWYKLTPEKIELIHEPTLGFEKFTLTSP